jgi:hypothetical protein
MAGAIGISDEVTWLANSWGWRQLMERAVRLAPPEYRETLERSLVQPGLELPLLAEPDRVAVVKVIVQAAEDLIAEYEHHENEYDRAYAEKLHKLVGLLNEEVTRLRSGG